MIKCANLSPQPPPLPPGTDNVKNIGGAKPPKDFHGAFGAENVHLGASRRDYWWGEHRFRPTSPHPISVPDY